MLVHIYVTVATPDNTFYTCDMRVTKRTLQSLLAVTPPYEHVPSYESYEPSYEQSVNPPAV